MSAIPIRTKNFIAQVNINNTTCFIQDDLPGESQIVAGKVIHGNIGKIVNEITVGGFTKLAVRNAGIRDDRRIYIMPGAHDSIHRIER